MIFFDKFLAFVKNFKFSIFWNIVIIFLMVYPFSEQTENNFLPFSDKIVHFVLFSVSSIFLIKEKKKKLISGIIFLTLFGVLTEFVQYFIPYRDCNFWDFLADFSGIVFGYIFLKMVCRILENPFFCPKEFLSKVKQKYS